MRHRFKTYTLIILTFLLTTLGSTVKADFVPVGETGSEIYFVRLLRDRLLDRSTLQQWQIQPNVSKTNARPAGVFLVGRGLDSEHDGYFVVDGVVVHNFTTLRGIRTVCHRWFLDPLRLRAPGRLSPVRRLLLSSFAR